MPFGPTPAGRPPPSGSSAQRSASHLAGGRARGSVASAATTSGSRAAGTPVSSAFPCSTRKKIVWKVPLPYGCRPVAANATVAPQECTSDAPLLAWPSMTSGARYPGVPITMPVCVSRVESGTCAMPKSITTGCPSTSITLPGLRSRCTTPAAWIAAIASASPPASRSSACPRSGPSVRTTSSSVRPGTYLVTMYGASPVTSASRISATYRLRTRRMVSTSRSRRRLAFGSAATAGPRILTATGRLSASRAR